MDTEAVEAWLESKGIQLWADWEILRPERRKEAAEWFVREVNSYIEFIWSVDRSTPAEDDAGDAALHEVPEEPATEVLQHSEGKGVRHLQAGDEEAGEPPAPRELDLWTLTG